MAKPLGLEQLLKMAEDEKSISTKVLIYAIMDSMKAQDAKLDQVMQTHAANFEERAKGIAEHASLNLGVVEGNVTREMLTMTGAITNILMTQESLLKSVNDLTGIVEEWKQRLDKLENPGKTDNNMRQP